MYFFIHRKIINVYNTLQAIEAIYVVQALK